MRENEEKEKMKEAEVGSESKTLTDGESWKPQGEIHIMSGKPMPVIKDLNEEGTDEH